MSFDFSKLTDASYLFNTNPGSDFAYRNSSFIVFGLIIVLAVILWIVIQFTVKESRVIRRLRDKFFYLLLSTGIVGIILVLFRMAGAVFLSTRAIFLLFLLGMLGWLIYIIFYLIFSFSEELREEKETKRKERYLP